MKDLAEYIVKQLVSKPEEVEVEVKEEEDATILNIKTASDDIGKVIGKNGKTANAIRTVLRNIFGKTQKRVIVKFAE